MRRDARIGAFKLIFETLFKESAEETFLEVTSPLKKKEDKEFCEKIFDEYQKHRGELQKQIEKSLTNFDISRVYKIDLALTYLALTEIEYCDTPKAVAINEAVEISKKFSTLKSSGFINGLLSAILSDK